ncbi:MAG: MFS transporter [Rothia sp. (in: high G+C Gram-positive bacteria)]|nr:MFS transporter [Rothia sp. (in: high G+C Gram-positive bacteria)]
MGSTAAADTAPSQDLTQELKKNQLKNLLLATIFSTIGFWAWTLIGPLAKGYYAKEFDLTPGQVSLLIATPILVGALARIPVGALADNFGGRIMFTIVLGVSAPLVLLTGIAGLSDSFAFLMVSAFLLGLAGTVFAVGAPFTNLWYEKHRRGFSSGVFGAGMIGTGLNAFLTPRLFNALGYWNLHLLMAAVVGLAAVLSYLLLRESPLRPTGKSAPLLPKIAAALKLIPTWQFSALCAIGFGAFVSFSNYLPTYLGNVYGWEAVDAGTRTAGFALVAVIARPIAGSLADRISPKLICLTSFILVTILAMLIAFQPEGEYVYGTLFLLLAGSLGIGIGGLFAWLAQVIAPEMQGSVAGVVGALGAFGGFFPPLVMGATYNEELHSYFLGLTLLAGASILGLLITLITKSKKHAA